MLYLERHALLHLVNWSRSYLGWCESYILLLRVYTWRLARVVLSIGCLFAAVECVFRLIVSCWLCVCTTRYCTVGVRAVLKLWAISGFVQRCEENDVKKDWSMGVLGNSIFCAGERRTLLYATMALECRIDLVVTHNTSAADASAVRIELYVPASTCLRRGCLGSIGANTAPNSGVNSCQFVCISHM